jgi:hypothetical protein
MKRTKTMVVVIIAVAAAVAAGKASWKWHGSAYTPHKVAGWSWGSHDHNPRR